MKPKSIMLVAATAAVFAVPAAADEFSRYDKNQDGSISLNEWNQAQLEQLRRQQQSSGGASRQSMQGQRQDQDGSSSAGASSTESKRPDSSAPAYGGNSPSQRGPTSDARGD